MNYHTESRKIKVLYSLQAAHSLDMAILNSQLAKPSTMKDDEDMSKLISLLFNKTINPSEFTRDVDSTANEAIDEYNKYKIHIDKCTWNKRIVESFSKWYVYSNTDSAMIKVYIMYILYFGRALSARYSNIIDSKELNRVCSQMVNNMNHILTYNPRMIKRCFAMAMLKYSEIEAKVNKREGAGIACAQERRTV